MLPRWHILLGAVFTLIIWVWSPQIGWLALTLIFLSSFLIDFDHFMAGAMKIGSLNPSKVFSYHDKMLIVQRNEQKRGIRRRGDFHIFHTVEFHLLVFFLGFLWVGFWYILIGMVFHSLLDIISLLYMGIIYRREYFFSAWLARRISSNA